MKILVKCVEKVFKRLMRHLRASAACGREYGDLDQLAKEVSKAKHAAREKRRRDNLKKVDAEAVLKAGAKRQKKSRDNLKEIDEEAGSRFCQPLPVVERLYYLIPI